MLQYQEHANVFFFLSNLWYSDFMNIKRVELVEIDQAMEIIDDAKELLKKSSSQQWQNGYPNREMLLNDINNHNLFGAYIDGELAGICALVKGVDENYDKIYDGEFKTPPSGLDLVIHRIAVKKEFYGFHLGNALVNFACDYAKQCGCISLKIDTHIKNKPMQALAKKNDFTYSGIILIKRENVEPERLLFEKTI